MSDFIEHRRDRPRFPRIRELPAISLRTRRRPLTAAPAMMVPLCVVVGSVLLVSAYHHAAGLTTETDQITFALYWLGFLAGFSSLAALATAIQIDALTRTFALVGLALFGSLPKLLRSPVGPLDSDEYGHFRQIIEAYLRGDVGHVSHTLRIVQYFPGLHQAVSAIAHLTGLPAWPVALAVVVLAHVLSILGIYQLVHAVGATPAAAATGAVVYSLNPSWVNFDASVAYESLALPLLIWCIAAAVTAARTDNRRSRVRYVATGVFAAVLVPVVHHLTTLVLCALLLALTVGSLVRRRPATGAAPDRPWPLLVVTLTALTATALWLGPRLGVIAGYLSPSLVGAPAQLGELAGLSSGSTTGSAERILFAQSHNPSYEVVAGLLFPAVVLGVVLIAGYFIWPRRHELGPTVWVFAALAGTFFVSLPALFTTRGSEGAHRSWAFSFIGVAVLAGLARSFSLRGDDRIVDEDRWGTPIAFSINGLLRSRPRRMMVAGVVIALLAVGGTAASHENVSARFPGVPRAGDDVRSIGPDETAVSNWIATQAPPDTPVLASRYASFELGSSGRMATLSPSARFPLWDMYIKATPISPRVLKQVYDAKLRYIVVDSRMATVRPALGYWFTVDEPGAHTERLYPAAALARFNCLPWLRATFGAGPLTVYQVDRDVLIRTMAGACGKEATP